MCDFNRNLQESVGKITNNWYLKVLNEKKSADDYEVILHVKLCYFRELCMQMFRKNSEATFNCQGSRVPDIWPKFLRKNCGETAIKRYYAWLSSCFL